jgi:hypothetical protein
VCDIRKNNERIFTFRLKGRDIGFRLLDRFHGQIMHRVFDAAALFWTDRDDPDMKVVHLDHLFLFVASV